MAFSLPASVYSPALVETVAFESRQYLDWYRQTKTRQKVGADATEEPTFASETVETITSWFEGKAPTVEGLERLITYFEKLKLPVAHVTMAALPNHAQRASLVSWFRTAASSDVLVAFTADRTLGGGIVVRTPNHIYDWSWRQKLVDGRAKLAEIVRHV